jgi:EAL domain-containing protein (putative c-di-GMP-specific phosphodiesterase class I)
MDDFGTGYSSLSCLHHFPIDVLKIDRTFILNTDNNREYAAVIHAIITLAHTLKMTVVGEGVESGGQLAQLQALECDAAQGNFFSKPLSVTAAEAYMRGPKGLAKSA